MTVHRIVKRYKDSDPSRLVNYLSREASAEDAMGRLIEQVVAKIHAAEKRRITRYQLAKEAGVYQSQLSRLVKGERSISVDTLERICAALSLNVEIRESKRKKK